MAAKYKFDGKKLTKKHSSATLAKVKGDKISSGIWNSTTANVRGDKIYEGNSTAKVVANVRGGYLCSGNGSSRIRKMKDVHNEIEGPGETIKAALWWYFVK